MTKQRRTNADKLRKMVDGERLGATTALEIMQEWEDVREHAEALAAIAAGVDVSGPSPLTKQLTIWRKLGQVETAPGWYADAWRRTVADGALRAIVAEEPMGWHLSISFADDCSRPTRYPTWDEIAHARYELLPDDVDFVMHLPPPGEYVACHPTTFHLHEHPERT